MKNAQATVIAHSISDQGIPLITFQLRYWRPIHSELMTHRVFSRNAGSSRARPSKAIIEQVRSDPWGPLHWGANQPGMQAGNEINARIPYHKPDGTLAFSASPQEEWAFAAKDASKHAQNLLDAGYHKQIVNRLLEPFTYIDVVLTGTDFGNWFALRDHPDADPGIQDLARAMKKTLADSKPAYLNPGQWHLPYITEDDPILVREFMAKEGAGSMKSPLPLLRMISAARCARVSYKAFDGTVAPISADLDLFNRLVRDELVHASPTEHQASPDLWDDDGWVNPEKHGNFRGWIQHRKLIPNEYVKG